MGDHHGVKSASECDGRFVAADVHREVVGETGPEGTKGGSRVSCTRLFQQLTDVLVCAGSIALARKLNHEIAGMP